MLDPALNEVLNVIVADNVVAVSLVQDGEPRIGISLANALFDESDTAWVKLCTVCEPFVFVPVHDASSTYGAVTGIAAWKSGQWNLPILPLQSPYVGDADANGVSMLKERWTDAEGMLVEQAFGFHRGSVFALSEPERVEATDSAGTAMLVEAGRKIIKNIHPPVKVRHPYGRIKVSFDEPELPDDLVNFVEKILKASGSRDASALAAFLAEDFFLERDYGGLHEAGSPSDIFLAAVRLDDDRDPAYREANWQAMEAQLTIESGGAKLVHGSGGIVPLRAA